MLLLVLILILIAFGLLVVALLTGSVLWAWVSVAVSAVAALVLVVDALQRRAAVRAGAQAEVSPQDRSVRQRSYPELDPAVPEPVTEILPVVPPGGSRSIRPEAPAPEVESHAGPPAPPERKPVSDQAVSAQRTQVMGPVQPPGSEVRPPGAAGGPPPSGGTASPSVTDVGAEVTRPPGAASKPGEPAGPTSTPAPAEPAADAPPSTAVGRPDAAGAGPGNEATVVVRAHGSGQAPTAARPVELAKSGKGGSGEREDGEREGGATVGAPAADAKPDQAAGTGGQPITAGEGAMTASEAAAQATTPAEAPVDEPAVGGDPPEETREPAVSAVVALLQDEVLVVDEQPRYHVTGCRALATRPTIPLTAREAVELGFTPCGWCSPDRTLADRHPARAQ